MLKNKIVVHTLAFAAIILGVVLCYHHTMETPFVFDDRTSIVENNKITDLSNFFSVKNLKAQRPLTDFTFALNYHLGGLEVAGYHAVNIFIHVLSSLLVYLLALNILGRFQSDKGQTSKNSLIVAAAFAALVFALHPVQTQAVTYVVQRYTSMSAMFYLLSVFLYILGRQVQEGSGHNIFVGLNLGRFVPLKTLIFFGFSFLCGLAAFLSKQSALSLPLAVILVEYAMFDRTWAGWKKKIIFLIPLLALFVFFVLYSTGALRDEVSLASLLTDADRRSRETLAVTRLDYLLTQFKVIPIYLGMLIWPVNQNIDHMYPFVTSLFQSWTLWGMLLILLIAGTGLWFKSRQPVIFLGIFWFFIALSVESSVIPIRDAMFEHRMYLAMLGPALIAGLAVRKLCLRSLFTGLFAAVLVLSLLGAITYHRNSVWLDPVGLWADSISKNPTNYRGLYNYGLELARQGDVRQALEYFQESLRMYPGFAKAHHNAGLAYQFMGNNEMAMKHYQLAVKHDPGHNDARLNIAVLLANKGDLRGAADRLNEILKDEPENVEVIMNLSVIAYNLGSPQEALSLLEQVLELRPDMFTAILNKGIMHMELGQLDEAERYFKRAYRIRPGDQKLRVQLNRLQSQKAQAR